MVAQSHGSSWQAGDLSFNLEAGYPCRCGPRCLEEGSAFRRGMHESLRGGVRGSPAHHSWVGAQRPGVGRAAPQVARAMCPHAPFGVQSHPRGRARSPHALL
eukprot:3948581-Alexandrium_andersonii.AAC.1